MNLDTNNKEAILKAIQTGFILHTLNSNEEFRPKLINNNISLGNTVLSTLENELKDCQSFQFLVAFITKSGLVTLKNTLIELQRRKIPGKILTTDYLLYNEPDALRDLLRFENLEVKVYTKQAFHIKGYLFNYNTHQTFIVGSSNLTQEALKRNKEWNLKLSSLDEGEVIRDIQVDFQSLWNQAMQLTQAWIDDYEQLFNQNRYLRQQQHLLERKNLVFKPNSMQTQALKALDALRKQNKNKALLISATGTGKTFLSVFDVSQLQVNRVLFLAHRENILVQAKESFEQVIKNKSMGILSGTKKNTDSDFLFSTITMMSKPEVYTQFLPDYFDYIIIDETHRAGAISYLKVLDYFKPQFLLGMTATPERTDNYDIFQLFDYNIAYEIRLQHALEDDILCPFHYFGISELEVNGELIHEKTDFRYLVSKERVNHIINMLNLYGYSGNRPRGLIFCSRIEEAEELAEQFNQRGLRTLALSGKNSEAERTKAIERLESLSTDGDILDYIFTVDIFNEGIDIPAINQVIMLRPTQSAIIFVQQLGRGLRKFNDKEYVVVLDFIGNYEQNFLIPIALSGDRSLNKDSIRRFISEANRMIPGISTVSFDEITKRNIFNVIDRANLSSMQIFKNAFYELKNKLGRIPNIFDYEKFGSIDVTTYFDKFGSYYSFLSKLKLQEVDFNEQEELFLTYVSQKFAKGKRFFELLVLVNLIKYPQAAKPYFLKQAKEEYHREFSPAEITSIYRNLTNQFGTKSEQKKFNNITFIKELHNWSISDYFQQALLNIDLKNYLLDIIIFGLKRYENYYQQTYKSHALVLYEKYTYAEVCYLLNWQQNLPPLNIGGYKYDAETNTFPVFINYEKSEGSIQYEDRFISSTQLIALSKNKRSLLSKDREIIYNAKENGTMIYLFVRKNKDDEQSKEFYFLGSIEAVGEPVAVITKDQQNAFEILYQLNTPVRDDIYDYLTT